MPSVRLDNINDPRFSALGMFLGTDEFGALGRMAKIYEYCTVNQTSVISEAILIGLTRVHDFVPSLIKAELGEKVEGGIRIKGTEGRIEWLGKWRENGKKGGRPAKNKTPAKPNENPIGENEGVKKTNQNPPETLKSKVLNTKDLKTKNDLSEGSASALPAASADKKNQGAKEFIATMVDAYQKKYRVRPVLDGPTLGAVNRLLKTMPLRQASDLYQVYLQIDDDWFCKKSHDFATFMANLQKVAVALGTGKNPAHQKSTLEQLRELGVIDDDSEEIRRAIGPA